MFRENMLQTNQKGLRLRAPWQNGPNKIKHTKARYEHGKTRQSRHFTIILFNCLIFVDYYLFIKLYMQHTRYNIACIFTHLISNIVDHRRTLE